MSHGGQSVFRQQICINKIIYIYLHRPKGGLAQLVRALAWHARGHRFESDILHKFKKVLTIVSTLSFYKLFLILQFKCMLS